MAVPSLSHPTLEYALKSVLQYNTSIKNSAQMMLNLVQMTRKQLLDYTNSLSNDLAIQDIYAAVSGVGAYAQTQLGKPTLDIVAEYAAMRIQAVAVQDWIVSNFPKDGNGNLAVYAFDVNKRYVDVLFTTGELTAIKVQLTNLVNMID
jgi:hypothetical protein